jgi:hypothetical protein
MNKPFMPTNPPVFSMRNDRNNGNFGIRNGEDTVGDINTKFSERQKEYERMSIPPVTPSNQSIFNISKIETNELNRGFDMRDEEEIAENAKKTAGFVSPGRRKY